MLKYQIIPVTPFQQNCTLLWCDTTLRAAVVDPGGDLPLIEKAIAQQGVKVEKVILTHGHLDHVGGVVQLATSLGIPIEGPHKEDLFWLQALPEQSRMLNLPPQPAFTPQRWLEQGDTVTFGEIELEVLFTPGHTPGHIVFFHRPSELALVGDVLFRGSIGRTDFPRGDFETLIASIREQLWPLGDSVQFIPGHGPMSTFGHERLTNSFVADKNFG